MPSNLQEKTLFRISAACGLIGIIALALANMLIEVEEKDIARIMPDDVDRTVRIKGTVDKITEKDRNLFLTIIHPSTLQVVIFKEENAFSVGDRVEVTGKIQEYKGRYEMIGEEVRLLKND